MKSSGLLRMGIGLLLELRRKHAAHSCKAHEFIFGEVGSERVRARAKCLGMPVQQDAQCRKSIKSYGFSMYLTEFRIRTSLYTEASSRFSLLLAPATFFCLQAESRGLAVGSERARRSPQMCGWKNCGLIVRPAMRLFAANVRLEFGPTAMVRNFNA